MARPPALPIPASDRAFSLSISEMKSAAARGAELAPRLLYGRATPVAPPSCTPAWGTQEVVCLSDDLLLVRSDVHSNQLCSEHDASFEIDTRGWLYLHFRLDGISVDRLPDGPERTVCGGSFLVCASSQPIAFSRRVLSDVWQVVTIAFQPSATFHNLSITGAKLPVQLQRFHAGDPGIDFFYASPFTPDMRLAAGALLKPLVNGGMRPFYLHAKALELVCLAVEQVGRPPPQAEPAIKLSHRDVRALEDAKRLVDNATENHSLGVLARHVGINRRKLALGFKLLFGNTVGGYQREVRLELARQALEERAASVGYAAAVAGYCDVGSFGKAFKAKFGWLPSQSRHVTHHAGLLQAK